MGQTYRRDRLIILTTIHISGHTYTSSPWTRLTLTPILSSLRSSLLWSRFIILYKNIRRTYKISEEDSPKTASSYISATYS